MRVWINFRPGFQKLRHALARGHLAIILQPGYRFQSAFGIKAGIARLCIELQVADRIYSGVGEGDGELGCASDDSAVGDAIALIFFLRSSSRRRNRSARSAVAVPFSAARASNNERSRIRA